MRLLERAGCSLRSLMLPEHIGTRGLFRVAALWGGGSPGRNAREPYPHHAVDSRHLFGRIWSLPAPPTLRPPARRSLASPTRLERQRGRRAPRCARASWTRPGRVELAEAAAVRPVAGSYSGRSVARLSNRPVIEKSTAVVYRDVLWPASVAPRPRAENPSSLEGKHGLWNRPSAPVPRNKDLPPKTKCYLSV